MAEILEKEQFFSTLRAEIRSYCGPKVSRQFQFARGNFNLLTAVSICSRQFQLR